MAIESSVKYCNVMCSKGGRVLSGGFYKLLNASDMTGGYSQGPEEPQYPFVQWWYRMSEYQLCAHGTECQLSNSPRRLARV
jgi:hypothetical protein